MRSENDSCHLTVGIWNIRLLLETLFAVKKVANSCQFSETLNIDRNISRLAYICILISFMAIQLYESQH